MKRICTMRMAILFFASRKQIVHLLSALLLALPLLSLSQPENSNNNAPKVIPELVFQNPVLVSGTDKSEGSAYLFKNVASGIDALLEVKKISDKSTIIKTLDLTQYGWNKAFQPEIGREGNVNPNQNWWIRFRLTFLQAGTDKKTALTKFYVTALDLDGDNLSIREYIQMQKADSINLSKVSYVSLTSPANVGLTNSAKDKLTQGPVQNFKDIDTATTGVMVTYVYLNTSEFDFTVGAQSGAAISNAGMRLNSLWFKSFSLAPQITLPTLPLQLISFQGNVDNNKAGLQWSVAENETGYSFELEKSFDGIHFTTAALIFTTTKTGAENYSYKESIPQTSFYRLKMINKDNSISYSKVIRLTVENNAADNQIRILQNPVSSLLQFTYKVSSNESSRVNIYSASGVKVFSTQLLTAKGINTYLLNLKSDITAGIYLLEIINGNERTVSRFIKE
jgi:hypothetical protein